MSHQAPAHHAAVVDLRSDTVTRPTPAMREAMMAAPLGDDVFGDDPTINQLHERIAAQTGKEAALFMPSGTQSKLCGIDGLIVKSAETNVVFVDVAEGRGSALLDFFKAHGVLASGMIGLRFVTHLGVSADGIDHAIATSRRFFSQSHDASQALAVAPANALYR